MKKRDLISELRQVNNYEHKTVYTTTAEGIEQAERLKEDGWSVVQSNIFMTQFQRKINPDL